MDTKEIIFNLRTKNGMSQDELAEKVFVTRQPEAVVNALRRFDQHPARFSASAHLPVLWDAARG